MKNLKPIFTLLIGAVIGFSFCQLFHRTDSGGMDPVVLHDFKSAELEKKVKETETAYQQQTDSLTKKSNELNKTLKETQLALNKTKKTNIQLQTQVYDLIDHQQVNKENYDTASYISGCDSLEKKTVELITASNQQDSIHEAVIINLTEQLQNKDSAILLKDQLYQSLKSNFDQGLLQQKVWEQQAKYFKKKIKRQKLGSRLKSIGLLVLSGLAARQLIY